MTRTRTLIALATAVTALAGPLRADTLEMIGNQFIWNDPNTWFNRSGPDHVPGPGDTARFDFTTFGYSFFLNVDATCHSVIFNDGASTWISLPSDSQKELSVSQSMSVKGDQLQLMSLDLEIGGDLFVSEGVLMSANGVNLSVLDDLWLGFGEPFGAGTLSVGSGSFSVASNTYVGVGLADATLSLNNTQVSLAQLYVPAFSEPTSPGTGQVNVTNGAVVTTGLVAVATTPDTTSVGEILVTGAGTRLDPGTSPVFVGTTITSAGSIILEDHAKLVRPASSSTTVHRTGSISVSGGADIELAGLLDIQGGTVSGEGGGLEMLGTNPEVRVEGHGQLDLSGSFTFGSLSQPPSNPMVTVMGASSAVIEDHWRMGSSAAGNAYMQVFGVDSAGIRSRLLGTPDASDLVVGDVGPAVLEVRDGGLVNNFRDIIIGNLAGASGTLNVTGQGPLAVDSLVDCDGTLYIGGGPGDTDAHGDVTASDGGRLVAGNVILANQPGGEATLTIGDSGAAQPSSLVTSTSVLVGGQGTAELTLWSNGSIDAGSTVQVLPGSVISLGGGELSSEDNIEIGPSLCSFGDGGGLLQGNGVVDLGFEDSLFVCGRIRPGGVVAGETLIDVLGNFVSSGVLEVELGGTTAGVDYGRVAVTGNAHLSSIVEVTLAEGYVPVPGTTYDVLTAATVTEDQIFPVQFTLPTTMAALMLPDRVRIVALVSCAADLDGNGVVDTVDFLDLLSQWGTDPGGPPDFNLDGTVDTIDFLELLSQWGPCN